VGIVMTTAARSGSVPLKLGFTMAVSCFASACSSLDGAQPRLTAVDMAHYDAVCPSRADMAGPPAGMSAGAYRDQIISLCVGAINANYSKFTRSLSKEAGLANLTADVISQGLSTAASVVTKGPLASKLAAGSALSLGLGASVNKDLFYKQTLPAIIASMDARRNKVLTAIARSENSDPDARIYTLARAAFDLDQLQDAGSLNAAVQELTTAAVQNAAQTAAARQQAESIVDIGTVQDVTPDIDERFHGDVALVRKLESADDADKLKAIALALGLAPPPGASARQLSALIRIEMARVTTMAPEEQGAFLDRVDGVLKPYEEKQQ
jgi:hypothetical protein